MLQFVKKNNSKVKKDGGPPKFISGVIGGVTRSRNNNNKSKSRKKNNIPKPGDSLKGGLFNKELGNCCNSNNIPFENIYILDDIINEGTFGIVYKTHHVSSSLFSLSSSCSSSTVTDINPNNDNNNNNKKRCNDDDENEIITKEKKPTFAVKIIQRKMKKRRNNVSKNNITENADENEEVQILYKLRNIPNVVQLIDYYIDSDNIYIVQELAQGGDVFDRLLLIDNYTEKDARELSKILLSTIVHIHDHHIIHRDLKPENLLLKNCNNNTSITLCDFGSAKQLPTDGGFISYVGSPSYCAPEVVLGKMYREPIDNWSIGCIIFLLLSGLFPFGDDGDDDLEDNICNGDYNNLNDEEWDEISGGAKAVVKRLLTVDPKKRWTAKQALEQSRWFNTNNTTKSNNHLQRISLQRSKDRISKYILRRKLKAAGHVARLSVRASFLSQSSTNSTSFIDKLKQLSNDDDESDSSSSSITGSSSKNEKQTTTTTKTITSTPSNTNNHQQQLLLKKTIDMKNDNNIQRQGTDSTALYDMTETAHDDDDDDDFLTNDVVAAVASDS